MHVLFLHFRQRWIRRATHSIYCLGLLVFAGPAAAAGLALSPGTFANPPQEARPMIWWHWVNGNVSREGIEKDLQAMKAAGLGGFHLFDVAMAPPGPARYGNPEWIANRAFALGRAKELGLSVGLNCGPGWSTAAGPWVTPEQSMKYLVWTETHITGGNVDRVLPAAPAANGIYHDVAVLALPCTPEDQADLKQPHPAVEIEGIQTDASTLVDGDDTTTCALPKPSEHSPVAIRLSFSTPVTVQGFECALPPAHWPLSARSVLESSQDGQTFTRLREFWLSGGHGTPPVNAVNFTPVTARYFRLSLYGPLEYIKASLISELRLRLSPRVEDWGNLSGRMIGGSEWAGMKPGGNVLSGPPPQAVLDLSTKMDATGRLRWTAPVGDWTIYRFAYTSTGELNHPAQPEATGLEVDKMDPVAVRDYLRQSVGRDLALPGAPVSMVLVDSWESGAQNWTASFQDQFLKRAGYDIRPWLPVLAGRVIGSTELSARFLWDFRQCVSKVISENFYGALRDELKTRGVTFYSEPYGGPAALADAGVYSDAVMSEFWVHEKEFSNLKNVSSFAHATGRSLVAAESFTAMVEQAGYRLAPSDFKTAGDRTFAQGLNQVFLHSFVHQPYDEAKPGFSLGLFGSHFTRHETWWPLIGAWTDYLARCQLMLRQGLPQADVAYLRLEDAPGLADLRQYAGAEAPADRDYDFIASADLLAASVSDGWLVLPSGVKYRVLVLPQTRTMRTAVAEKLLTLVKAGLHVVGPAPEHTAGLKDHERDDARLAEIRRELWAGLDGKETGTTRVGEGSMSVGRKATDVLADLKLAPDFSAAANPAEIVFCHRSTPDREIYFVANVNEEKAATFTATFRAVAEQVELWDPLTGRTTLAKGAQARGAGTELPLELSARQSLFVVFPKAPTAFTVSRDKSPAVASTAHPLKVDGPWRVTFENEPGLGALVVDGPLVSLSQYTEPKVKHYAGSVTYRTRLTLPAADWKAGDPAWLDLGRVAVIGEVRVNGRSCGTAWIAPYRVSVGDALRAGENELEIRVATTWANRLIGDASLPDRPSYDQKDDLIEVPAWLLRADRATSPEAQRSFLSYRYYKGDEPLMEAGLLGPVVLELGAQR